MIIPYNTDAPLYHLPIVTVLMIVLNSAIFFVYPFQDSFDDIEIHLSDDELASLLQEMNDAGELSDEDYQAFLAAQQPEIEGDGEATDTGEVTDEATMELASQDDAPDPFTLHYGRGLKPWQWITGHFLHADIVHLVGNMIWLWTFGLIVEGKLGWGRFLAVYLGIGLAEGLVEQTLMLGMTPGPMACSVGASSIIFGLMAMAMIWAPANDIHCFFFFLYRPFFMSLPAAALGGLYMGYSVVIALIVWQLNGKIVPTSELLHALGGIVGIGVGIAFLRWNMVDCENWDLFSVWAGRHRMSREELQDMKFSSADFQAKQQTQIDSGLVQIRQILQEAQNPQLAYRAHVSMKQKYELWHLPDAEFLLLIKQLCDQKLNEEATLAMGEYLQTPRTKQNQVRLKLATILLEPLERPSQALAVVAKIDRAQLNEREAALFSRVVKKAKHMKEEGVIDTVGDAW